MKHYAEIEYGSVIRIVCESPEGSDCRMVCRNANDDGYCASFHERPHVHDWYDMGECNWSLWINEDPMEYQSEALTVPVSLAPGDDHDGFDYGAAVDA